MAAADAAHPVVQLLFDRSHYRRQLAMDVTDLLSDYLERGWRDGLDPHPLFSTTYYLEWNPDVAEAQLCPLVHYALHGAPEGRRAHPLFDPHFYRDRYLDISDPSIDPLAHYVRFGGREGRDPNPWFDGRRYLRDHPNLAATGGNPLAHYVTVGWLTGSNPHPDFDAAFYRQGNPDLGHRDPLTHFLERGWMAGREPRADHALRRLLPRRVVVPNAPRLVVLADDVESVREHQLLEGSASVLVSPPGAGGWSADYVYAPDEPPDGLTGAQLLGIAAGLAVRRYDFVVASASHELGSTVRAASASAALVLSADGFDRRRHGRPMPTGSIGRQVQVAPAEGVGWRFVPVDELGLGELLRFDAELVVAGGIPIDPPRRDRHSTVRVPVIEGSISQVNW